MSTKIFVGRLSDGTTNDELHTLFRKFGTVTEAVAMGNYGFVHMSAESEARAAIAELDNYSLHGSRIHVELSTATTQGRKKRSVDSDRGGRPPAGRYEPYPPGRREGYAEYRGSGPSYEREPAGPPREDYASDQVKDLLELYFRDPYAFDQYAKTYYYGERAERARAYYDRRMPEAVEGAVVRGAAPYAKLASANYASSSGVVDVAAAAAVGAYSSRSLPAVAIRDDRYRPANSAYSVGGGRF